MTLNRLVAFLVFALFLPSVRAEQSGDAKVSKFKIHGGGAGVRTNVGGDDRAAKLADWLGGEGEATVDLTEAKLKAEFGLTKEDLMAEGSGFTAGTCTPEGCTFKMDGGGLLAKSVRVLTEKGKAVKVAAEGEQPKFDEHGNRIIASQAELEAALRKEDKKKVVLLFSSSIKEEDKLYAQLNLQPDSVQLIKAPQMVRYKDANGNVYPYELSKLPAGRYDSIFLPDGAGVWAPVKSFVKGPLTINGVSVGAGEYARHTPAEKLVKKVGDKYEPYNPKSDTPGRKSGNIFKQDGNGNYTPMTLIRGPFGENGKAVAGEGQVVVELSSQHCPPCRELDKHLPKFMYNAKNDTKVYVVDTGKFIFGGTPELQQLRSTYIGSLGWPNGVVFEKGAKSDSQVEGYGVTMKATAGSLPSYIKSIAYPR